MHFWNCASGKQHCCSTVAPYISNNYRHPLIRGSGGFAPLKLAIFCILISMISAQIYCMNSTSNFLLTILGSATAPTAPLAIRHCFGKSFVKLILQIHFSRTLVECDERRRVERFKYFMMIVYVRWFCTWDEEGLWLRIHSSASIYYECTRITSSNYRSDETPFRSFVKPRHFVYVG
jgi:hypothetical protein